MSQNKKDNEAVIRVENVRKHFKIYKDKGKLLRERLISASRNQYEVKEVLRGISFEVSKGETVGLIGKNGCGKSTTLKLLTKILKPNEGKVTLQGRVCSLIELGAGFHPDMTGRENVYINASIFGLSRKEIDARMEDIIRFSELEESIDEPVRTYSSGMYMRLAFSVAINVSADILLIDEILAVGDQSFQMKCFNRMMELKQSGVTIVLVSHSLGQVENLCDRAIWIENGRIRMDGPARKVCLEYQNQSEQNRIERAFLEETREGAEPSGQKGETKRGRALAELKRIAPQCGADASRVGIGKVQFTGAAIQDREGKLCRGFAADETMVMDFSLEGKADQSIYLWIQLRRTDDGVICYAARKEMEVCGTKKMQLYIPKLQLKKNRYFADVRLCDQSGYIVYDQLNHVIDFTVEEKDEWSSGVVKMDADWRTI